MRRLDLTERSLVAIAAAGLTMHYQQWPREWQVLPWWAARAEDGPQSEVGTHFFHIMELFGHGVAKGVQATASYPGRPEGSAADASAHCVLKFHDGIAITHCMRTDMSDAEIAEQEVARAEIRQVAPHSARDGRPSEVRFNM